MKPADHRFEQGYEADNPNIELLRLRNFTLGKGISDEMVIGKDGLATILDLIGAMVPFVSPPLWLQFVSFENLQDAITSIDGVSRPFSPSLQREWMNVVV